MLREIKNSLAHYFEDENGLKQGEVKMWYRNGQPHVHCFCINGRAHGEYRTWWQRGTVWSHCFQIHGKKVSFDELPYPETNEERMLFLLKYDLPLLPVEAKC